MTSKQELGVNEVWQLVGYSMHVQDIVHYIVLYIGIYKTI